MRVVGCCSDGQSVMRVVAVMVTFVVVTIQWQCAVSAISNAGSVSWNCYRRLCCTRTASLSRMSAIVAP